MEGALRVFDGIDLQAAIQRLQPLGEKQASRKGRARNEPVHTNSQHAASLVLEAIYLKAKSLQKLGRVNGMDLAQFLLFFLISFMDEKQDYLKHHCFHIFPIFVKIISENAS